MQNTKKLPLIVLIGSLSACGGNGGMPDIGSAGGNGVQLADTAMAATATGATAPADSGAFLATAYQDGLAEIQLSQLALQKASTGDVKQFAQRMVDHHTALNKAIAALAQSKNIALPTTAGSDRQAQAATLSTLPGSQFELAYLQQDLVAHEKALAAARLQAQQGTDPEVRRLAKTSLPLLQAHLAVAEEIASGIDPGTFLALAYRDGLAEVQLSQLAVQKATNPDVRRFAQRMIDEHTQANARLTTLAQQKGLSLPGALSAEQQAIAAELGAFAGSDFDEAYMDANVLAHAKAASMFRRQANGGTDPDIKALASDIFPTLVQHLLSALRIDRSVDPSLPFRIYQDGEAEIALSLLALNTSANADVRAFAQRMIDEHGAANAQLLQLAQQNNRMLPSGLAPEHLLAIVELMRLSAQEFDRAYLELNVQVHQKDVQAAQQELQSTDVVLRTLAQAAVPVLSDHLARARALRDQLGIGAVRIAP